MSMDGQRGKWGRHIVKNLNQLTKTHKRYSLINHKRQTDDKHLERSYSIRKLNVSWRSLKIIYVNNVIFYCYYYLIYYLVRSP